MGALIAATNVRLNVSVGERGDKSEVVHVADLYSDFGQMDAECGSLNPFGFPRRIIRATKVKYAQALVDQIRAEYSVE